MTGQGPCPSVSKGHSAGVGPLSVVSSPLLRTRPDVETTDNEQRTMDNYFFLLS
jgi:hypothetical protein